MALHQSEMIYYEMEPFKLLFTHISVILSPIYINHQRLSELQWETFVMC